MSFNRFLVLAGLLFVSAPVVFGEAQCPGSATSLPLRLIQNALFVTPVYVNGTGPFDFLVDTGAQVNTVDESLATELHLTPERSVGVSGTSTYTRNALVRVELAAGGKKVAASETVVAKAEQLRAMDSRIRGILGGTFLQHFDFLLDNQHHVLCLDDSGTLIAAVKGQKIALADPLTRIDTSVPFTRPLVVSATLSGFTGSKILVLDSGSNSPSLFLNGARNQLVHATFKTLKRFINGVEQDFAVLSPQEVRIGTTVLVRTQFAVPMNSIGLNQSILQEDGVMPTIAYRRILISCSKGYAVLVPWN